MHSTVLSPDALTHARDGGENPAPAESSAPPLTLTVEVEQARPIAVPDAAPAGGSGTSGTASPSGPTPTSRPTFPSVSEATRHVMQANKSKNTKPELLVRADLRSRGLTGYRIQYKRAAGRPDVAFPGRRVAIFVHGCFWHRCPYCHPSNPKINVEFWQAKFARNRQRDERSARELVDQGWTVIVVWECRLKKKRARRTMSEVACEVRLCRPVVHAADRHHGRVVVMGRGQGRYARILRHIRATSRLSHLTDGRPGLRIERPGRCGGPVGHGANAGTGGRSHRGR